MYVTIILTLSNDDQYIICIWSYVYRQQNINIDIAHLNKIMKLIIFFNMCDWCFIKLDVS